MSYRYKMSISSEEYEPLVRLHRRISKSKTFADAICGMVIEPIEDTNKKLKLRREVNDGPMGKAEEKSDEQAPQ